MQKELLRALRDAFTFGRRLHILSIKSPAGNVIDKGASASLKRGIEVDSVSSHVLTNWASGRAADGRVNADLSAIAAHELVAEWQEKRWT